MPDIPGWNIARFPLSTPDTPSGDFVCRVLRIPDNDSWTALVNGVLSLLMSEENFKKVGTSDVVDTVQVYSEMFVDYLMNQKDLIGTIVASAQQNVPDTMLDCDGAVYLEVDYPDLYATLDSAFIIDGVSFSVPDLRNRFIAGVPMFPIGTTGGVASVTLTEAQMPSHTHQYNQPNLGAVPAGVGVPVPVAVPPPVPTPTTPTGGDGSHTNLPPGMALHWYIIAKC